MMVNARETAIKAGVVVVGAFTTLGVDEGSTERSVQRMDKHIKYGKGPGRTVMR